MAKKSEEVAARSQDVEAKSSDVHEKVFVILKKIWDNYDADSKKDLHEANILATRQGLITQGLRPQEDGKFVGASDHGDDASVDLTYAVKSIPASEDPVSAEHHVNPDAEK